MSKHSDKPQAERTQEAREAVEPRSQEKDEQQVKHAHNEEQAAQQAVQAAPVSRMHRLRRLGGRAGIGLAVVFAFAAGMCLSTEEPGTTAARGGHDHDEAGEEVWTCPMHPQIRQSGPGTCPICGMELVRVDQSDAPGDDGSGAGQRVTLSERARTLARIRTTDVRLMATTGREIRLLGRVDYDETRIKTVTAWTGGRIDNLLVSTTGQTIRPGQVIAKLYSPEIYAAQSDLIQAGRQVTKLAGSSELARASAQAALDAARQRLSLLGVTERDIKDMESAASPTRHVGIHSPFGGTVIERLVSEGNYVSAGTPLYRLADLSRLWVQLDAYEADIALLHVGDPVSLEITGIADQRFTGKVAFIDPVIDPKKRTSRVRVEVQNPKNLLKPGMFAEAVLAARGAGQEALMVPESAPLYTGQRSIVYVEVPGGERPTYEAREVVLGPKVGVWYPVLSGLELGDRVVTRGAFVLDADLQIKGGASMMTRADDPARHNKAPVTEVPAPLAKALEAVLAAYLGVQEALAADDLQRAQAASQELAQAVTRASAAVPERLRGHWDEVVGQIDAYARYLANTDNMTPARKAFEELSSRVVALLERFGNPTGDTIRLAYCPMAFDGRGATWVQRRDTIANSYFGAEMPNCGEIQRDVAPGAHLQAPDVDAASQDPDQTPAAPPAGHVH